MNSLHTSKRDQTIPSDQGDEEDSGRRVARTSFKITSPRGSEERPQCSQPRKIRLSIMKETNNRAHCEQKIGVEQITHGLQKKSKRKKTDTFTGS